MMTPQEINAYVDKLAKDYNISRLKAEQIFWKAYVYIENEPQYASFGTETDLQRALQRAKQFFNNNKHL